jgi:hypothetical protein
MSITQNVVSCQADAQDRGHHTVTVPAYLLCRDVTKARLLIGFDDPARGLTLNTPCYLGVGDLDFQPVSAETGELIRDRFAWGWGLVTLSRSLWHRLPDLTARKLEEEARERRALRAEADRKERERESRRRMAAAAAAQQKRRRKRGDDQGELL